jgi:hypothetical protein
MIFSNQPTSLWFAAVHHPESALEMAQKRRWFSNFRIYVRKNGIYISPVWIGRVTNSKGSARSATLSVPRKSNQLISLERQ